MRTVSVTESILVHCPCERVWDFTQDYRLRPEWDSSVLEAAVIEWGPVPKVRVRFSGGVRAVLQYKEFDRPRRTSLALQDVESMYISGGGGSWSYEEHIGGTIWTQTNTLIFKTGLWSRLLASIVRRQLRASTRRAMKRARNMLEQTA